MPIYVYRDALYHNVIRQDYIGNWNIDEFRRSAEQIVELLKDRSLPRMVLVDLSRSDSMPIGLLNASRYVFDLGEIRDVEVIMVSTPSSIRAVLSTTQTAFPNRIPHMKFVKTMDEAYSIIQNV